jgi:hypothetical protein
MIEGVAAQLNKILDEYTEKVDETSDEIMSEVATDTADELKRTSPTKSGNYAKSWTVKKDKKSHQYIVHNKKYYRLTHLLEYGHIVKNQFGTYGRAKAEPHIKRAEENGVRNLINKLEQKL